MMRAAPATLFAASLGVALLAGCADPAHTPLGGSRAQVLQRLGPPTAVYALPGGERLQYSRAPAGTSVTDIDLDAAGTVVGVAQVLDEARFAHDIGRGVDLWRQGDVLRTYGRPEQVTQVSSFDGTVWQWRYRQLNNPRLLYVYLDPEGVVRRWHTGDDLRYFNTPSGPARH